MQGLARIRDWLLSIKHEQEISNHFDQRLAEKEFGRKADEAESENKEEQEKDDRAYFRLHGRGTVHGGGDARAPVRKTTTEMLE